VVFEKGANVVAIAGGLPLDGGELERSVFGPSREQAEEVAQVRPRLDVAEPCACQERSERGVDGAGVVVTDEEPILTTNRDS
jgi:hypothetical protein